MKFIDPKKNPYPRRLGRKLVVPGAVSGFISGLILAGFIWVMLDSAYFFYLIPVCILVGYNCRSYSEPLKKRGWSNIFW